MSDAVISVPTFVHHDTGPILSIDCHPSGTKFITCGQKSTTSKGLVVVWNMDTVLDKNTATNENVPKTLFQLDPQSQSNTCRWSPDGKRFAFGSDDSSVSVFEYAGRVNSQGSIGSGAKNVERYKECCILRGHRMEVLSVEWSPNGRFLASGSLDYRIIIYNAREIPQQIAMLTDCDMPVKGLSWDPIGKYLASLEGDKKLRFWSTDTWQCLTTITEPFATSIEETVLSRLDWSPDGKSQPHIASKCFIKTRTRVAGPYVGTCSDTCSLMESMDSISPTPPTEDLCSLMKTDCLSRCLLQPNLE